MNFNLIINITIFIIINIFRFKVNNMFFGTRFSAIWTFMANCNFAEYTLIMIPTFTKTCI